MNDLILFALKEEAPNLFGYENVFEIGVGKVNAAITTMHLIQVYNPKRIINLGTAGGITVHSGIHRVNKFIQHDVNLQALGKAPGEHLGDSLSIITKPGEGITCATGDFFVSERDKLRMQCDVVEMEAYSIAKACLVKGVEFEIWKYVSDTADESAGTEWKNSVSSGEEHYMKVLEDLNVDLIEKEI